MAVRRLIFFKCTVQYLSKAAKNLSPNRAARGARVGGLVYPLLLGPLLPNAVVPRLEGHSRAVPIDRDAPLATVVVAGIQKNAIFRISGQ